MDGKVSDFPVDPSVAQHCTLSPTVIIFDLHTDGLLCELENCSQLCNIFSQNLHGLLFAGEFVGIIYI